MKDEKADRKKRQKRLKLTAWAALAVLLLSSIGLIHTIKGFVSVQRPELEGTPRTGEWYRITPPEARSADGGPWHGLIRLGKENKLLIYFLGNGAAVDAYTAARPSGGDGGFYTTSPEQDYLTQMGIADESAENPFRDWSILALPYSTGDFHSGAGEYAYTGGDGGRQTLYCYGYRNYTAFMEEAVQYTGQPDALLIAGYSAGGFGAALLADDIISKYFPNTENRTVLIDSALLLSGRWQEAAEDIWHTPPEISARLTGSNLTLDSLSALSEKYGGGIKILFGCSVRDGELAGFQAYFRNGEKEAADGDGDIFQQGLREMAAELQTNIPGAGIYIWDGLAYDQGETNLTQHGIIFVPDFYRKAFSEGKSIAQWAMDAVNGAVRSYGLELAGLES